MAARLDEDPANAAPFVDFETVGSSASSTVGSSSSTTSSSSSSGSSSITSGVSVPSEIGTPSPTGPGVYGDDMVSTGPPLRIGLIVGLSMMGIVIMLLIIGGGLWWKKRRETREFRNRGCNSLSLRREDGDEKIASHNGEGMFHI